MEADWETEIGPDAPIIDALWPGFVDLLNSSERIAEIAEAQQFPALAEALRCLNHVDSNTGGTAAGSQVWTAKCDVWPVDECDPSELDATPEEAQSALACYVDLLPRSGLVFAGLDEAEAWARSAVSKLRQISIRHSRTDLVIRRAFAGEREGLGITAYITACGPDKEAAKQSLNSALAIFAEALFTETRHPAKA